MNYSSGQSCCLVHPKHKLDIQIKYLAQELTPSTNLRLNSLQQGEHDAPTESQDEEHANDVSKSKYIPEVA